MDPVQWSDMMGEWLAALGRPLFFSGSEELLMVMVVKEIFFGVFLLKIFLNLLCSSFASRIFSCFSSSLNLEMKT